MYEKMVVACLQAGYFDRAWETVERSKSRLLVELLAAADLEPQNASPQQKQQLRELRRRISTLSLVLEDGNGTGNGKMERQGGEGTRVPGKDPSRRITQQLRQELSDCRSQLNQLLDRIGEFDPDFTLTQRVETLPLTEIQALLDEETVLLQWYVGFEGFYTFIVTRNYIDVVSFSGDQLANLTKWAVEYLGDYRQPTWTKHLGERLQRLTDILRLEKVLDKVPHTCQQLLLVPHRYLHLFPLHALPLTAKEGNNCQFRILNGKFPQGIRYAPSCQLLQRLYQRREAAPLVERRFFALANPTEDLPFTELEVSAIRQTFSPYDFVLVRKEATTVKFNEPATQATLKSSHFAHFACHGAFNFNSPLYSALILAGALSPSPPTPVRSEETREIEEAQYLTLRDGRRAKAGEGLTLQDIFAKLELPQCRLVALSACETGLTDPTQMTDEYIGLVSGFLYAGSPSVVNSLWCVDDFATALLMIRFYQLLLDENLSLSVFQALQQAQDWLKSRTKEVILDWLESLGLDEVQMRIVRKLKFPLYTKEPPFAEPQYWAAFCAVGK